MSKKRKLRIKEAEEVLDAVFVERKSVNTAKTTAMKIIVPAYFDPGPIWDMLLASRLGAISHLIINPNSGPGYEIDPAYSRLCLKLRRRGVSILGYVSTRWGERDIGQVLSDVAAYHIFYGIKRIFLDEAATLPEKLDFYRELYDKIQGTVVLNPGAVPDPGYFECGDAICIFESDVAKLNSQQFPAWLRKHRAKTFQIVINCPPSMMQEALQTVARTSRHVFITHAKEPNPYDALPTYWRELLKAVK